jgi:hypothetical protein
MSIYQPNTVAEKARLPTVRDKTYEYETNKTLLRIPQGNTRKHYRFHHNNVQYLTPQNLDRNYIISKPKHNYPSTS